MGEIERERQGHKKEAGEEDVIQNKNQYLSDSELLEKYRKSICQLGTGNWPGGTAFLKC